MSQPVTAALVARLRDETNEPMMECKKALVRHDGDYDAALKWLLETPFHIRRMGTTRHGRCPCCGHIPQKCLDI